MHDLGKSTLAPHAGGCSLASELARESSPILKAEGGNDAVKDVMRFHGRQLR